MLSSQWRCDRHGAVAPLCSMGTLTADWVRQVADHSGVPVWLPWPLPTGWMVTGAVAAGVDGEPSVASALICSGPGAGTGPAELVLVCEEPGVGLGAGYAGLPGPDVGTSVLTGPPSTRAMVVQHETPLWEIRAASDRSVYVGEAGGRWLWAIAWPMEAGLVLHDDFRLIDVRDPGHELDMPIGAKSPRWRPGLLSGRDAEDDAR